MDLDFENLNINCKRAAFSIGPYIELTLIKVEANIETTQFFLTEKIHVNASGFL
ncbi:hypothetical protein PsalN5692_00187 [Piscirickettsia salmonis]|nr:hypothetical protein PsalN5692_00187 [Piscirickettsia salmonis]